MYELTMIPEVIKNKSFINSGPFLNLKNRCNKVNKSVNNTGSKAGYKETLSINSPFSNAINER
jgi:hypothetical protein